MRPVKYPVNEMSILDKLFKRQMTGTEETYYVHGSGLIGVPRARMNEIPKVIRESHEAEITRAILQGIARR